MNLSCKGCESNKALERKDHAFPHNFPAGTAECIQIFCDHCGDELDYFVVKGVIRVDLCDVCIGEALLDETHPPNPQGEQTNA